MVKKKWGISAVHSHICAQLRSWQLILGNAGVGTTKSWGAKCLHPAVRKGMSRYGWKSCKMGHIKQGCSVGLGYLIWDVFPCKSGAQQEKATCKRENKNKKILQGQLLEKSLKWGTYIPKGSRRKLVLTITNRCRFP